MNQQERVDPEIPEGHEWLQLLRTKIINPCYVSTVEFIASDSKVLNQVNYLGTVLSLLDRLSSCYWGCHKGDHTKEYLLGRACNSTSAAWILIQNGHYDASLALVREVAEIANLFMLFQADANSFQRWTSSDDTTRMREFGAVKVRLALEGLSTPAPISKDMYKALSERATHITPRTRPELYSNINHPFAAGNFQENGVRECLALIGFTISKTALTALLMFQLTESRTNAILSVASALVDSTVQTLNSVPAKQ